MAQFVKIGTVLVVNLDNVNYFARSPRDASILEIHFGNETASIEKLSPEDLENIMNKMVAIGQKA